jgi:hypothetical protein
MQDGAAGLQTRTRPSTPKRSLRRRILSALDADLIVKISPHAAQKDRTAALTIRTCRVEDVPTAGKSMASASRAGDDLGVLVSLWPLFGLTVQTSRLTLRLPREQEIAELASIAGRVAHRPSERPFLTSWTAGDPQDRARFVLQGHWGQLGTRSASAWRRPRSLLAAAARRYPGLRYLPS